MTFTDKELEIIYNELDYRMFVYEGNDDEMYEAIGKILDKLEDKVNHKNIPF